MTAAGRCAEMANRFPEAAVIEALKEVEGVLLQIRARIPDSKTYIHHTGNEAIEGDKDRSVSASQREPLWRLAA